MEPLSLRLAVTQDAPDILALRLELEEWLAVRGVEQWGHGGVSLADIAQQIADGEWHVASDEGSLVGVLRLLWSDERIWQKDNGFAAYVHGLMVPRAKAGQGIGMALLSWATQEAAARNAPTLRLDCVETNTRLRTYYMDLGFREVGRRDFGAPWGSATLLEKSVRPW